MNRVAVAFSTRDRVELSKQAVLPLCNQNFNLFWIDGSTTKDGEELFWNYPTSVVHGNVRGGADAAIVFSLTTMLKHPNKYTHIGLVENDVMLDPGWFAPTMALFDRGEAEGLVVGAVSARCYEDRIFIQRDGYAVCHNLGAGMVIFTREAAELILYNFRTGWWTDNRRTFMQLSGIDIGRYAAFRANEQWCTADWHWDAVLAELGYASLALTPSPVEMIGQNPPLAEQGLKLVTEPVEARRDDKAFGLYRDRLKQRRERGDNFVRVPNCSQFHQRDDGQWLIFPHQIAALGGRYEGDWKLKWSQGFGPFAWKAGEGSELKPQLRVPISGPCSFLVSGGETGGIVEIEDLHSGYKATPPLPAEGQHTQVLNLVVPGGVTYREIRLIALLPGVTFYGVQTKEPQLFLPNVSFNHSVLPPA